MGKMKSKARHLQTTVYQKHQSKSQCQVRFDFQTNWTLWQPQYSLSTASASAVTSNASLKSSFKLQMHKLAGLPRVLTSLLQQLMLLPLCLAPLNLSVIIENCIPYWQWGDTFYPLVILKLELFVWIFTKTFQIFWGIYFTTNCFMS